MKQNLLKVFKRTMFGAGFVFTIISSANAQVGIGTKTPDASAMLDVFAADKGVLFPRVSLVNITDAVTVSQPATGLTVWNTNMAMVEGNGIGLYSNFGTKAAPKWLKLVTKEDVDGGLGADGWLLTGNVVNPAHFIGTNNAFPFIVKTNATEAMRIDENQLVGIGTAPFIKGGGIRLNVDSAINTAESYNINGGRFVWDGNKASNTLLGHTSIETLTGVDNTVVGHSAGRGLESGAGNVIMGARAGFGLKTGSSNVLIGRLAGTSIVHNIGVVAIGVNAGLKDDATGNQANSGGSVYIGANAGKNVTSAGIEGSNGGNVMIGLNAGSTITNSEDNIFIGNGAGQNATGGSFNVLIGLQAGQNNTQGGSNTFIGSLSGVANTTGAVNTFVGAKSGIANTTGASNSYLGNSSGLKNKTTLGNTFIGSFTGANLVRGSENTFVGANAGWNIVETENPNDPSSNKNTFIGIRAGSNSPGNLNFYGGYEAGIKMTGEKNVLIGANAGTAPGDAAVPEASTALSSIFIGANAFGVVPNNLPIINAVAIGTNAKVGASNAFQLGNVAQKVSIGDNNGGVPEATLDVDGDAIIETDLTVKGQLNVTVLSATSLSATFLTGNLVTATNLNVNTNATVTGALQAGSSLILGNSTINGAQIIKGNQTVQSQTVNSHLTVNGSALVKTNLIVDGATTLDGNTTTANVDVNGTLTVGPSGTAIKKVIKVAANVAAFNIGADNFLDFDLQVPNAAKGAGAVQCSPQVALPLGVSISFSRVSDPGIVKVRFYNTKGNAIAVPAMKMDVVVIE